MNKIKKYREILIELIVYALYIFAVVCAFWWLGSSHSLLAKLLGISDAVQLDLGSVASVLSIVAAAMAIIISNRQEGHKAQQSARDQIYQQLELESIKLFRFEIDNVELARVLWDDAKDYQQVKSDKNEAYRVLQHLCQILNLFEMAARFKRDGIVHEDVFTSWEAWIFDLCNSDIFLHYWYLENVRANYIELFQNIIDVGLRFAHGDEKVDAVVAQQDHSHDQNFSRFRSSILKQLNV